MRRGSNDCSETHTLTTHKTRSEAQRKQSATTGNKRANTEGGGVNATKATAPRQGKMTEYIDLRGGCAVQGKERHAQRSKVNSLHIQPVQNHPQPKSHQPHFNPSHPNPNSAGSTTIPYPWSRIARASSPPWSSRPSNVGLRAWKWT